MAFFVLSALGVTDAGFAKEPATATSEAPVGFTDTTEPYSTGWEIVLDNDALVSTTRDKDYTAGIAVALGGSRVTNYRFSLDPTLSWINRLTRMDRKLGQTASNHVMQFGLMLFTPEIDAEDRPVPGDRPFANLLFLENSQFLIDEKADRAYQSSLTVGILGSKVGEVVQNAVHRLGGFSVAGGYGKQISDGGELTARYAVSRQSLLLSGFTSRGNTFELKYRVEGDIGYITEGSATLAARWGRVGNSWWSFAPSRSNYLPQPIRISRDNFRGSGGRDFFLWSAITLRAKVYNAFLQGQFRDSEVTFSGDELNHILGELSVGLNRRFGDVIDVGLALHYQTSEIKRGTGSRNIRWGSLTINKSF